MEAKDTVIKCNTSMTCCLDCHEAQAEISFKAGIREVVESDEFQKFLWFADNVPCISEMLGDVDIDCECATCLSKRIKKAKLKEWGI